MNLKIDNWNYNELENLILELKKLSNEKFKNFNDKIINTTSKTIGVQIPKLRLIAKEISKGNYISFLSLNMPDIFELHIIYALVLSKIKDINLSYPLFKNFIYTINNWAVCDILCGEYKIVLKNKEFYLNKIKEFVKTNNEFVVRVGLILLMKFYIKTNLFEIFEILNTTTCNKYYVNMGIAWLLSTTFIFDEKSTLNYINTSQLSYFVKNKTFVVGDENTKLNSKNKIILSSKRLYPNLEHCALNKFYVFLDKFGVTFIEKRKMTRKFNKYSKFVLK